MRHLLLLSILLVAALTDSATAQTGSSSTKNNEGGQRPTGSSIQSLFDQQSQLFRPSQIPQEGVVDENEYIVGPNDIFALMIPGVMTAPQQLIISPDGVLAIPGMGEIKADGLTLAEVKERVQKGFRSAHPTFTLVSPRQFYVSVFGTVRNPGPYIGASVLRLDKVVAMANVASELATPEEKKPLDFSRRRILLRRKGDEDRVVDLEKYYILKQSDQNPLLREGDIIIVPPRNIDQAAVSVYGAVNAPNQYEYKNGDSLSLLIRMAQGLTPNADSTNVELTRLSLDAATSTTQVVDISGVLRRTDPDIALNNRDRILVREKVDRRMDYKVHVRGEIKLPGMYPITPDSTRLSEIIARAGGFTPYAYLPAAEIVRKQLTSEGTSLDMGREALLNLRMSDQIVTPEEKEYYDLEAKLRRGTVTTDFVRLFQEHDPGKDIFLQDGDDIFIPSTLRSVYVYGQVGKPGFVAYKEGADFRYYIGLAGGYGDEAEDGQTRVIKGKTREWMDPSDTIIEPGDFVWVPKNIRYPTSYYLNLVSQAASFISVVLSMTVIIIQLSKK